MADVLVAAVLEHLTAIVDSQSQEERKLLKGVEEEIPKIKKNFEAIKEALDDAERRSLKDDAVKTWVDQLKDICYDMEDVLDEWRTKTVLKQQLQPTESASWLINKVISRTPSHLPWTKRPVWSHLIALKIKEIKQRLDEVVEQKGRFKFTTGTTANEPERPKTTSFVDVSEIYRRDDVEKSLISRLLSESSQEEEEPHNLSITAIVGMGGIGKTTLAQLAYNDENVRKHFDQRIWVCVSDPFNVASIARSIMEGLGIRGGTSDLIELPRMLQEISEAIKKQKFLLILDDVWNQDRERWEPLRSSLINGAKGSKILVTTRSERVAIIMKATNKIHLGQLSAEECWSIFSKIAFSGRSKEECKALEEIGRMISKRCKGLPLAAKVLGCLMHSKKSRLEWQNVLDSDLWELEEANKELDPVFMLSYYDLPSPMKLCFSYCAIFPEDQVIERDRLIQLWIANGFLGGTEMEGTGDECFKSLAMRSLFQDFERDDTGRIYRCKMHNLVREFALHLSRYECGAIGVWKDEEPSYAKIQHVRWICTGDHSLSALSKLSKGPRTLVTTELKVPHAKMKVLRGLFCHLTSLRTLELSSSDIKELPVEIAKLIHLRYLGLERNEYLEALPETVCDLYNLQTLKLSYCFRIEMLPRGIGKLLNLRHLECEDMLCLKKLPKGIGQLTSLRTLRGLHFSPNENSDDSNREEYFGIGDLEKLNCLRGNLRLYSLGNVKDSGEAERAGLKNKKDLRCLLLNFNGASDAAAEEEARAERDLLIAKALEPPPFLQYLSIRYYRGTEIPSWITSLSSLEGLSLHSCPNLKKLPCEIKRPLLHKLSIGNCPALAAYCKQKMKETSALDSIFDISD